MPDLKVHAPYEPTGDQPTAIASLVDEERIAGHERDRRLEGGRQHRCGAPEEVTKQFHRVCIFIVVGQRLPRGDHGLAGG